MPFSEAPELSAEYCNNLRTTLLDPSARFYAADESILDPSKCDWSTETTIRDTFCHVLSKEVVSPPPSPLPEGRSKSPPVPVICNTVFGDEAIFSLVGIVNQDDFYAHGLFAWEPEKHGDRPNMDPAKAGFSLSFSISAPKDGPWSQPFVKDFAMADQHLQELAARKRNPAGENKGFFGNTRLKFRHRLFRYGDSEELEAAAAGLGDEPEFTLDGFPVRPGDQQSRDALVGLKGRAALVPLPLYDPSGDLVKPSHYTLSLKGAVVLIRFKFIHYKFTKNKRVEHTWSTETTSIRVLDYPAVVYHGPRPVQLSPKKKDPFQLPVPGKRQRIIEPKGTITKEANDSSESPKKRQKKTSK